MRVFLALLLEFRVGILLLGELGEVILHGVTDGVGEGGLLTHEDVLRQEMIGLKCVAKEILALMVVVQLLLRIDVHHVVDEVNVSERYACLEGVYADAAVRTKYIVHVQLVDTLLGFLLEFLGARCEIGVLVAEELIGDLAGQEYTDVRLLVDRLAAEIHADGSTDGGDIIGSEGGDDLPKGGQDILTGHDDLVMVCADVVGDLTCILEVDRIDIHTDGVGLDRLLQKLLGDRTDERGVETTGKQEADRCIRIETLLHTLDEKIVDVMGDFLEIIVRVVFVHHGQVVIADELTILIVVSWWKWLDFMAETHEVLRLGGECQRAVVSGAIVEGTNTDRVPRCDVVIGLCIVDDERELCVEHAEHVGTELTPERKQDLAVRIGLEGIAFLRELLTQRAETVDLAVADHVGTIQLKRLHAGVGQAHDGETVEAEVAVTGVDDTGIVRSSRFSL